MTGAWVLRKFVKIIFFVFFMIFLKSQTVQFRNFVPFELSKIVQNKKVKKKVESNIAPPQDRYGKNRKM